ncbi:MAG: hypothetical protein CSYNP_02152 [Syntrophus sp. SKADARSKE-3]|nr:hypothetical protein [Syntrophus sp. SKADARSKE-3]
MKLGNIIFISIVIIVVQLFESINFAMSEEYYLIGTAGINEMEVFSLNDGVSKLYKKINLPGIMYFQWPNYNRVTHDLYFEGVNEHLRYKVSHICPR